MRVTRIGLTPLKGARHLPQAAVDLTAEGPAGDRLFCLVDPARNRVLRTVENPGLVRAVATWSGGVLTTTLPGTTVAGEPVATGETVKVDYWGRLAALDLVDGPWAAAYSELLGREVVLARSTHPGEVVYGATVSLVTTSSLDLLRERAGVDVDSAQFRATFTIDTEASVAHVEDSWVGRPVRLGEAEVVVRGVVPRCAVVGLDPRTGVRRGEVLRTLAGYREATGEVVFGVDAVVTRSGRVEDGAAVRVGRG